MWRKFILIQQKKSFTLKMVRFSIGVHKSRVVTGSSDTEASLTNVAESRRLKQNTPVATKIDHT